MNRLIIEAIDILGTLVVALSFLFFIKAFGDIMKAMKGE